mmetsp:Transcript_16696/g.42109  ORF Transcript_16696/g.42109 Transcript_16696/m.42109 type:complete len:350 (-) Transcript_16696:13-1062(-)
MLRGRSLVDNAPAALHKDRPLGELGLRGAFVPHQRYLHLLHLCRRRRLQVGRQEARRVRRDDGRVEQLRDSGPLGGVHREQCVDQCLDLWRDAVGFSKLRVGAGDDLVDKLRHRLRLEGRPQRQHFKEQAAERPDVTLEGVRLPLAPLGRHIARRAHLSHRQLRVSQHPRDAEVAQLHHAVGREEDVLQRQVAVDDAEAVDVLEREEQLREPLERLRQLDAPPRLPHLVQPVREVAAARVLHGDAQLPRLDEGAVVAHDEGVGERGEDVHLALGHLLVGRQHVRDRHALVDDQPAVVAAHEVAVAVAAAAQLTHRLEPGQSLVARPFALHHAQAVEQLHGHAQLGSNPF